ncbi:unnamed protein product [Amaranthus hypochondriacus]
MVDNVVRSEWVLPIHTIVEQKVELSNLDLLLPAQYVGVFLCYKKPTCISFRQMVSILKLALAKVMVHFYVFSSQVIRNSNGDPEIKCDNQGVEFIEAYSDLQLIQLDLYDSHQTVKPNLLSNNNSRVFSIKVTEMKCGGIIIGCKFDHRIADAYSTNMFLLSWAETSNSKPISTIPSFTKSLLNPRNPCSYNPTLNDMYIPIPSLPSKNSIKDHSSTNHTQNEPLKSRIYNVNAHEIINLQSQTKGTKLESFSAFLWKLISAHTSKMYAEISKNDEQAIITKTCKMGIVVDGRTRLGRDGLYTYFGNVISLPFVMKSINELNSMTLAKITQEVHEFLGQVKNKQHFEDLIDYVQIHHPQQIVAKIYDQGRENGPAFVVSSGQRFPVSNIDFGWGKPLFGSYDFPWNGDAGYVMPMPSTKGNGDWIVYMLLNESQLDFIEKEASHVFQPFKFT